MEENGISPLTMGLKEVCYLRVVIVGSRESALDSC